MNHTYWLSKCFLSFAFALAVILVLSQQTRAQDSGASLFGKTWTLTEMEGRSFSSDKPNIEFDRDSKRVSGSGGCNRFGGTFAVDGSTMKLSRIFSTKMACLDADVQRVETSFLRLLETTTRFEVQGNTLRLSAGDRSVLVFVDRAAESQSQAARITGTISYRQRIALTPRAVVEVRLLDVSRAGARSITIAQQTIKLAGRQVPLVFDLAYDSRRINPRRRYSIQVRIRDRNRLLFQNSDPYLVITAGHPDLVDVIVKPVGR